MSISIEEQNVKNSIIRLNERLNSNLIVLKLLVFLTFFNYFKKVISNERYNKTNGSDYLV